MGSNEAWFDVPGYDGDYRVSSTGRVLSLKRGNTRVLKPSSIGKGYQTVTLVRKGDKGLKQTYLVHRLVAEVFLGPCPEGHRVIHKDDDLANNAVDNLVYRPSGYNLVRARDLGWSRQVGESTTSAKLTEAQVREILNAPKEVTSTELAKKYPVTIGTISKIRRGLLWRRVYEEVR